MATALLLALGSLRLAAVASPSSDPAPDPVADARSDGTAARDDAAGSVAREVTVARRPAATEPSNPSPPPSVGAVVDVLPSTPSSSSAVPLAPPSSTVATVPTTSVARSSVPEAPASTEPPLEVPVRVAVIGDSLIYQSVDQQAAALRAAGREPTVFGDPGRRLSDPTIRAALAGAAGDPAVRAVVVATTSNDNVANARRADEVGAGAAMAAYRAMLEEALAAFGDRCVVLVDVRDRAGELYRSAFAPTTNEHLRLVAASRPNTVVVAWSDRSRDHAEDWFVADQLHFSDALVGHPATDVREAGRAAYADAIAEGVSRCSP